MQGYSLFCTFVRNLLNRFLAGNRIYGILLPIPRDERCEALIFGDEFRTTMVCAST